MRLSAKRFDRGQSDQREDNSEERKGTYTSDTNQGMSFGWITI